MAKTYFLFKVVLSYHFDQIGLLLKHFGFVFISEVDQENVNFGGLFWKHYFSIKRVLWLLFGQLLEKLGCASYFNIWSHWIFLPIFPTLWISMIAASVKGIRLLSESRGCLSLPITRKISSLILACSWCYKILFCEETLISTKIRNWKSLFWCLDLHKNLKTVLFLSKTVL